MKSYNNIDDIDTSEDNGKLLLTSLSLLTSQDFNKHELSCGFKCGKDANLLVIFSNILANANNYYKLEIRITDDSLDSSDDGKMFKACLSILTSDVCRNGNFGSNQTPEYVMGKVREYLISSNRKIAIDLII